jgi:hypothetical protein
VLRSGTGVLWFRDKEVVVLSFRLRRFTRKTGDQYREKSAAYQIIPMICVKK